MFYNTSISHKHVIIFIFSRFVRELNNLKQSADYSSIDTTDLNSFLKSINLEYSVYTYPMLIAGVTRDSMRYNKFHHCNFDLKRYTKLIIHFCFCKSFTV